MILFRVRLRVPSKIRDGIVKSLVRLVGPARASRGCLAAATYVGVEDGTTILYAEEWETPADLAAHLRTDDLRVLLSVMDLASEAPDIRFDTIAETRGMEVIAEERMGSVPDTGGRARRRFRVTT